MSIKAHEQELACEKLAIFKNQDRRVTTNAATCTVYQNRFLYVFETERGPLITKTHENQSSQVKEREAQRRV